MRLLVLIAIALAGNHFGGQPARRQPHRRLDGGHMGYPDDPGSMMVSNRLALAVIPSAASVRLHGRMADVALEARARRPRPLVDLGWALPVVSIFGTATFKGGTNSLPPEIHVGRVVASAADASIEMFLPFGRSGRHLF